jgi:ParB family protein of integrating conjugative element (PFGI_1 class)
MTAPTPPKGFSLEQISTGQANRPAGSGINLGLRQSLNAANPTQGNPHGEYRHDRIILVQLSEIDSFERNPRRKRNAEDWHELKESIRARGVENPIKVTQRPGSSRYVVAAGGNSRLGVMKELHQETQQDRFAAIPAQFVAYKSELELLVQHIIENEQRYEMSFWDKACALDALASDMGIPNLSLRELSDKFLEVGVVVSHGKLSEFIFATTKLKMLGDYSINLSSQKAIDLRKSYNDLTKLLDKGEQDSFDKFWDETIKNHVDTLSADIQQSELNTAQLVSSIKKNFALNRPEHHDLIFKSKTEKPKNASETSVTVSLSAHQEPSMLPTPFSPPLAESTAQLSLVSSQLEQYNDKTLHDCITDLLDYVRLDHLFRHNDQLPYEFYVELPELQGEFDGENYPIDWVHPCARDVYFLLAELSGQTDTTSDGFFAISNDSLFKETFADTQLWQAFIENKIGHPTPAIVQSWLMFNTDERFIGLVLSLFDSIRVIRQTAKEQ